MRESAGHGSHVDVLDAEAGDNELGDAEPAWVAAGEENEGLVGVEAWPGGVIKERGERAWDRADGWAFGGGFTAGLVVAMTESTTESRARNWRALPNTIAARLRMSRLSAGGLRSAPSPMTTMGLALRGTGAN